MLEIILLLTLPLTVGTYVNKTINGVQYYYSLDIESSFSGAETLCQSVTGIVNAGIHLAVITTDDEYSAVQEIFRGEIEMQT